MAAATFDLSDLLPVPGRGEGGGEHCGTGWDSSILRDDDVDDGAPSSRFSSRRPTVSASAVAAGSTVLGTRGDEHRDGGGGAVRRAASWSRPLPSEVVTLDGTPSLVAAATRTEVSLLKASTGEVLATKAIAGGGGGGGGRAEFLPRVQFVRGAGGGPADGAAGGGDGGPCAEEEATALAVLCPTGAGPGGPTNVILISNLDGPALDGSEGAAEALGRVEISSVPFPSSRDGEGGLDLSEGGPVTDVHAVRVGGRTVRLFARQGRGRAVSVMDYSLADRTCTLLLPDLGRHIQSQGGGEEGGPDIAGLAVGNGCLVVSETGGGGRTSLAWIDVLSLSVLARHDLPEISSVVSIAPVTSCHEDCVAAAVVTRHDGSGGGGGVSVQVVQSTTVERGGRCDPRRSMVLFAIDLDGESEVCPVDGGPYRFRCVSKSSGVAGDGEIMSRTFRPNGHAVVGEVHRALAGSDYGRAAELAGRLPAAEDPGSGVRVPFHVSAIGLHQFRRLLSRDLAGNAEEARECLRRLVSGAVADSKGADSLVEASRYLVGWPGNLHGSVSGEDAGGDALTRVTLQQVAAALSAMIQALRNASQVMSNSFTVDEQIVKLTERRAALEALSSIAPSAQAKLVPLNDPHLNAESIVGLLHLLVRQGAFRSVERIQREFRGREGCQCITAQSLAALALRVPLRTDPRSYLPWLCDTVLPSLHIGHGLLDGIRGWSCRAADYHDSDGLGLESSIELLAAVSRATARLTAEMNRSYVYPMQLEASESDPTQHQSCTPRSIAPMNATFDSHASSARSIRSRPTVLNIGMISGMKRRDGRIMSARRVASNVSNVSIDMSLLSMAPSVVDTSATVVTDDDDDESVEHDCVEIKLNHARRLKTARCLGLEKCVLLLADYPSKGEEFVVKELIKAVLDSPDEDADATVDRIRSFADDVGADFDAAVERCALELCDGNRSNISLAITQSKKMTAWCRSPSRVCSIVLRMLKMALLSRDRPLDLTDIARQSIQLAPDDETRSQLNEATRLLVLDSLVRKYCGNGAQTSFSAAEPMHGLRLVQHICRHIDVPSVLGDAMLVCDAFSHLSRLDVCVDLLERIMLAPSEDDRNRVEQCASVIEEILEIESSLAESASGRISELCAVTLKDCRSLIDRGRFVAEAKRQSIVASTTACSVLAAIQGQRSSSPDTAKQLEEFQKIAKFQTGCGVFLTMSELRDQDLQVSVISSLLQPCVDLLLSQRSLAESEDDALRANLTPKVGTAKHWCAILCDASAPQVWARAVGSAASRVANVATNHASLLLLEVSGLLDDNDDSDTFHSVVSTVVLTLFGRALAETEYLSRSSSFTSEGGDSTAALIAMRCMAQASILLREHLLEACPRSLLSDTVTLSNLAELVCDVSTRADMGIGERLEKYIDLLQRTGQMQQQSKTALSDSSLVLHPTWYVGDGLLLPPLEALSTGMICCKMVMDAESNNPSPSMNDMSRADVMHSLGSRGAYSTALRVLVLLSSNVMSRHEDAALATASIVTQLNSAMKKTYTALAERSLGGTESGITSGCVDGQLAVSLLLHMPKETAFKVYKSALPSAMSKRDFPRILTLASVGTYCCMGSFSSGSSFPWRKQRKFSDQCDDLSRNAIWWRILAQFNVSFDTNNFSRDSLSSSKGAMDAYCEKLVWNATSVLGPSSSMKLARKFMRQFGLSKQKPASFMIEFLLSPCVNSEERELQPDDIRRDLSSTEKATRDCLILLPGLSRTMVLRKCVIALEKDARCSKDYDRQTLALNLYRECLDSLQTIMNVNDGRAKAHQQETNRIERRQQALVIISSTFDNFSDDLKPDYSKMFDPLPKDVAARTVESRKCNILGTNLSPTSTSFDPLAPFDPVLEDMNGSESITTLLAPLCRLLLLPDGYLHARALIARFEKLRKSGAALPSYESSVEIAVKKLKACQDKADFGRWCSLQYPAGSAEQLKCLDMAYSNATQASEQAEASKDADEERIALERVKRIDAARAGLSDNLLVRSVLDSHGSTAESVKALYRTVADKVHERAQTEDNYCPETLVHFLLVEGSHIAALAYLDDEDGFTTHHFRLLALIVHDACRDLSKRYSHVNVGRCARNLTRQWLVHGDEFELSNLRDIDDEDEDEAPAESKNDGEDSSDFVMDIGAMVEQTWADNEARTEGGQGTSSGGESSAIKPLSSRRELADHLCSRVALRIAFLICFAEDYHSSRKSLSPVKDDENVENKSSKRARRKKTTEVKPRQKSNCFEGDLAWQHARDLLAIVFARQGSTVESTCDLFDDSLSRDMSVLSSVPEDAVKETGSKSKALSFAMRHRALRVATILCPQEVIARVVVEEMYFNDAGDDYLNKCAFGSYLAKEIESMGLTLPHSDLAQISSMHFPSFARTLWRNHAAMCSSNPVLRGRLHLLLLELCVAHHEVEWELFNHLFEELQRLELPRSLLVACEIAVQSKALDMAASQDQLQVIRTVETATSKLLELTTNELRSSLLAGIEVDASQCERTLYRLISIVNAEHLHPDPSSFVQKLVEASVTFSQQGRDGESKAFNDAALRVCAHLSDFTIAKNISSAIPPILVEERHIRESLESSAYTDSICSFETSVDER